MPYTLEITKAEVLACKRLTLIMAETIKLLSKDNLPLGYREDLKTLMTVIKRLEATQT